MTANAAAPTAHDHRTIERTPRMRTAPRHLADLPPVARPDHPPAHLDRLRDHVSRSSTSSCSGRSSTARSSRPAPASAPTTGSCPGLLIQVALFGTAFGGFGLIAELRYGVVERMRVTPMSRTAMLLGRSLRDVVILLFQALIMIGLAIPFGLHIDVAGVVVTLGLLALIGLVVAPLSYAAALILKSEDAFAPLVQSLVMPLLLLSGILLPMALAPDWLKFLSNLNPLTHATDAARALFNSDWGNPEIADRGS